MVVLNTLMSDFCNCTASEVKLLTIIFQRIQSIFYFVNQTMGLADHHNLYEVMIYLDQLKEYVVIVG